MEKESLSEKIIIECDCGSHLIMLQSEIDFHADVQQSPDFYFAIFHYGQWKRKFVDRIKLAWRILKTGEPYADQVVLNLDEAKKLSDFIAKHSTQNVKKLASNNYCGNYNRKRET